MKLEINKIRLLIYLIFIVASIVFASFFGGVLAYGFLYAMLLLIPLSILYTILNYVGLRVYQEIDVHKVVRGESHQYRVIIENSGLLPIYKMGIYAYQDRCKQNPGLDGKDLSLGVKEKQQLEAGIVCNYAGAYDIGIQRVSLADPFGIYQVRMDVPYKFRAIVKPQITDVANKAIEIENLFNSTGLKSDSLLEETPGSDIRSYQQGDSIHSINWKVSAKLNELVVRVPDKMEKQTVTVVLLADENEDNKYSLEAIKRRDFFLEFIVSAAWYFGEQQVPVKFIYPSGMVKEFMVNSNRSFNEFYNIVADSIFYNSPSVHQDLKNRINNHGYETYEKDTWIIVRENPKEAEEFCSVC